MLLHASCDFTFYYLVSTPSSFIWCCALQVSAKKAKSFKPRGKERGWGRERDGLGDDDDDDDYYYLGFF